MRCLILCLMAVLPMMGCGESSFNGGDSTKSARRGSADQAGGGEYDGASGGNGSDDDFEGGDGSGSGGKDVENAGGGGDDDGSNGDGAGGGGGTREPNDVFDGVQNAPVPQDCEAQHLLILDFKSGWWAGDGGETFQNTLRDEIEMKACPSSKATVEYLHVPGMRANEMSLFKQPFETYSQVWILSGSLADIADMKLDHPAFKELLNKIKMHKPRLFIGAGFGSIDHGNAVAKLIWGQDIFSADEKSGAIFNVEGNGSNITVKSRITPIADGNLFTGVNGPIADHVLVGQTYAGADEIRSSMGGVKVLANCETSPYGQTEIVKPNQKPGKPTRTVSCIAVADHNGFQVVLDSGLQRFFSILKTEEVETRQYFRNIVRALSL